MLSYPLTPANRMRLARAFASVPSVDISIACAVDGQMGSVFVDSADVPQFWMIEQDQFFIYLGGQFDSSAGREFIGQIPHGRFLMAGTTGWEEAINSVWGDSLVAVPRYKFTSNALSMAHLKTLAANNPHTPNIRRVDAVLVQEVGGTDYLSIGAFDSAEDFLERGIGFCLKDGDKVIGGAYSSLVCNDAIEVSIIVDEQCRKQGIATALASQLLIWCLDNHLAPHWDAANNESCGLAEKLGYVRDGEYTAYYLK